LSVISENLINIVSLKFTLNSSICLIWLNVISENLAEEDSTAAADFVRASGCPDCTQPRVTSQPRKYQINKNQVFQKWQNLYWKKAFDDKIYLGVDITCTLKLISCLNIKIKNSN
jgi:hypothetical protein